MNGKGGVERKHGDLEDWEVSQVLNQVREGLEQGRLGATECTDHASESL